ncbi:unnamed protein product [Vicia faba]|uniref:F-box domain-containing protein n=1 Tax=Vicia faba TaxID=3906 RepID=A0AAV0YUG7_VICFA|nr:unnamed protein product [Vicia faba]
MNSFNKLHPEIIHTHILSRLDGTTLTVLSSVSSEFRDMISNNHQLWKNICTTTWPYLRHWNLTHVISTFPCGYRSFFSDAFPSLHHQSQCIDLPPAKDLIYAIDMYFQGEPHPFFTSVQSQLTGKTFHSLNANYPYTDPENYFKFYLFGLKYQEKEEGLKDYFQENFRLNWILIDPTRKRAGSLFRSCCKPVSVEQTLTTTVMVYETLMLGLPAISTEMVKCRVKVTCCWKRRNWLCVVFCVVFVMEDMNGKHVPKKNANIILRNAIHNGERKKFHL